jgi:ribosomal protein S18 acetylase RimI-like enzyme
MQTDLLPATIDQQLLLMTQFDSAAELAQWGGENFTYPLKRNDFLRQLQLSDTQGFSLLQADGQMLGFGQLCDRFDKIHLARLLIFKEFRGKGYAKNLICALLKNGQRYWPRRDASLYVYRTNHTAMQCYSGLGFKISPQPASYRADLHFMTLPALHIQQVLRQHQQETMT